MIYTADEEAMREYSVIVQQIAYLDYQRNELVERLKAWEKAHGAEQTEGPAEEPAPQ